MSDLDRAIALDGSSVESYFGRAGVFEAQGKAERAIVDLRKAIDLKPKNVFEALAQTDAKKRIEQFEKRVPCGGAGSTAAGESCL
jgi:tetratricopeptide (TPR) repeat protein